MTAVASLIRVLVVVDHTMSTPLQRSTKLKISHWYFDQFLYFIKTSSSVKNILNKLWAPAQHKRASMLYFANVLFIYFLWPHYSPALVNGSSRKFYTWWTLSVIREVTTWIFSWSSLNYRVGEKVTKFGVFSDPTRKLSAFTPGCGRVL